MAEVDPLILEIRADLSRYRSQLQSTTSLVTSSLGRQEKSVQNLERQMARSSGAISGSLKGIAGALAGAFSVQQIGGLIDNFTRLQNSLRVSGLEGEGLANVQAKLLDLSTRYGVSINELANLYGKSSQAASDLGASEGQLLQITEASAQALKITGTSAAQAQGALLGLTQALSSGIVRAEEFNQINEGGLRPLLQVAANTERFGGSVAKLRAAVIDGKVSSQEFYQAILKGSAELDAKASKATLTLAGAFAALASQLTVYVGEASAANGVTASLSAGIGALAANLDTIIPLLAIIATGLGVGLVTNAIAARISLAALAAQAVGTTGALGTMALAARAAGTALLAAFGGIVGVAITALVLGIGYLVTQTGEAREASGQYAAQQAALAKIQDKTTAATEAVASATGKARLEAIANAKALRQETEQYLAVARAALIAAKAKAVAAQRESKVALSQAVAKTGRGFEGQLGANQVVFDGQKQAEANVRAANANVAGAEKEIDRLTGIINSARSPKVADIGTDKKKKKGRGSSGPTAAEIEARFNNELISLTQQTLSAQQSIAKSAEEKAELELRSIELARSQTVEGIKAEKDYSDTQKKRLIQQVEVLAFEEIEAVAVRERAQLAQEAADLAEAQSRNAIAALEDEYDLANSIADRARIAQQIVDTETKAALAAIDAQLLSEDIADAKRIELEAIRKGIVAQGAVNQRRAAEGNLSPSAQYLKDINKTNFGDETERFGVDALKDLNSGLADAIINGGNLGDVLEDTGKRFLAQLIELTFQLLVIKPLLESLGGGLGGAGSGGGGIFGNLLGSIGALFGGPRAGGGPVSAGRVYRVNEAGGEFFRPNMAGSIIPLSKMNAMRGGNKSSTPVIVQIMVDEGAAFVPRVQAISGDVAFQIQRIAGPQVVEAAVQETFRRGGRPRF